MENIGITIFSSVKDKEIVAEKFLKEHPDYNLYEVSDTIKINKGTLYHHLYTRAKKPWYVQRVEDLTQEVINVFKESNSVYGANKIVLALKKGIIADKKKTGVNSRTSMDPSIPVSTYIITPFGATIKCFCGRI